MKKIALLIMCLVALATYAYADVEGGGTTDGPHLWLSTNPDQFDQGGLGYIGGDSNAWISESYVTSNNPFRLYLYKAVTGQHSTDALNVALIVAVHSGELGTVTIKDEFGNLNTISAFTLTDVNPYYGAGYHGVYQNPKANGQGGGDAVFAIYNLTPPMNLTSGDYTWFDIEVSGFSEVHFDAFSANGFYNPPSHDVDYKKGCNGGGPPVPEPTTLSLLGMGLLGLAGLKKKRRTKEPNK